MAKEATELENKIIDYINSIPHCFAYLQRSEGRKIGRQRVKAKKNEGVGKSDIIACVSGRFAAIEVKIDNDTQSDNQVKYENKINYAKGIYFIARYFKDFLCKFHEHFKGIFQ